MRLLTEDILEPRNVPRVRHASFRLDADEPAQPVIAAQLAEHSFGGDMPKCDPQHNHPPEYRDREVITALAPSGSERVEQFAIGQRGEQILDGLERRTVFEAVPGKQRLGRVDDHHGRLTRGLRDEIRSPQ